MNTLSKLNDKTNILEMVGNYYKKYHENVEQNEDRIPYAGRIYDEKEMINLVDTALDFWLTSGRYTDQFEEQLARFLGLSYCSLVNSGSSANLLAVATLTSPLLKERRLCQGDEVITVAAAFPTTVASIVQAGAVPVFVDVELPTYNINVDLLEAARSERTKAVFIAHTMGNPFNLNVVKQFCNEYELWLLEDNCDALGSRSQINTMDSTNADEKCAESWKYTGTVGDIGTSSFYPPHHITMGEGGAVYTNNPLLHKIIRSMRDWGRDCTCAAGQDNLCGHRFDKQYSTLPHGYDHKYVYSHLGYNLKATDMQGAVGCAQLDKLPGFIEARKANWQYLREKLRDLDQYLILPEKEQGTDPSWFGFLMTVKPESPKTRDEIVKFLELHNIQTRTLFAGNITRHPCFEHLAEGVDYRISGSLEVTDQVMNHSFWIGVYPGMTQEMLDRMIAVVNQLFKGNVVKKD